MKSNIEQAAYVPFPSTSSFYVALAWQGGEKQLLYWTTSDLKTGFKKAKKYQNFTYKTWGAKRSEVQAPCFCKSYNVLKDKTVSACIWITFYGDLKNSYTRPFADTMHLECQAPMCVNTHSSGTEKRSTRSKMARTHAASLTVNYLEK